ncbi:MAG: type II toxin-antitoxin system prevent-host-death family antitoxin [Bryobacterales bacterium]|nr:type II toxin-antitoxin system prevent-host-death family antitoxin [Bryobacterales bacterium]MDE0628053.1 type II toxin-antitoxin system prevent-host-death family antitoxin [Bryobacterales bacterium]
MIRVNLAEAKAKLSAYVNRAAEGQTVVICRRNVPVAELRPVTQPTTDRRPVGIDRGLEIPDSFFEPLPSDLVDAREATVGDESGS